MLPRLSIKIWWNDLIISRIKEKSIELIGQNCASKKWVIKIYIKKPHNPPQWIIIKLLKHLLSNITTFGNQRWELQKWPKIY